ncbi:MAG: DUF721 domain-containing protein [Eggerthellaceae bacterium]|jgi:hypothetical protein|nr:DUF721 domain-containing protein [Eggerthellaceae bacterium]MDR2716097.1 hypothetical protein [Coriobacteriaceae bacterium]
MKKLSEGIKELHKKIGAENPQIKTAQRAAQVCAMWAACVEKPLLEHTNSVYIIRDGAYKTLTVYMSDSISAAEVNARRELIKLKLLQDFNEDIHEFKIAISRGRYKQMHPFKQKEQGSGPEEALSAPLDPDEAQWVADLASRVGDPVLKASIASAMTASLEWEKGRRSAETESAEATPQG